MKNKLKIICIFIFFGLLGVTFANYQAGGLVVIAAQNAITGVKTTNEEGLNPYRYYSYLTFGSIEELCGESNAIIKGEVINIYTPEVMITGYFSYDDISEPLKDVYTVSDVRVMESIKGPLKPGEVIQVRQLGGLYKGVEYPTDHPELFANKMQGVFFLQINDKESAELINPSQGFVKLIDGKIDNRPYQVDENRTLSEESKYTSCSLFENGMDQNALTDLLKMSIQ